MATFCSHCPILKHYVQVCFGIYLYIPRISREYGGVGIVWHKDLDQIVGLVEGGNERIQCIEISQNSNKPILIICVYMPTSGGSEKTNEYHETVDLLNGKTKW